MDNRVGLNLLYAQVKKCSGITDGEAAELFCL